MAATTTRIDALEARVAELEAQIQRLVVTTRGENCTACDGQGVTMNPAWRDFDDEQTRHRQDGIKYYERFRNRHGPPDWTCAECEGRGSTLTMVAVPCS